MSENLNPNIDPRIRFKQLPPATIIKNFVFGDFDCNYEIYLLELLNLSPYFRGIGNSVFHKPEDESHGQCDAVSKDYKIDFKLLSASSRLQASSLFSLSINNIGNGITTIGESKKNNGEIQATQIHVAFRDRELSDLFKIKNNFQNVRKQCLEKDIFNVLSMVEKQKNLLLFFPYDFSVDDEVTGSELDNIITHALNYDFSSLFKYRNHTVKGFDTYFLTTVCGIFYIWKIIGSELYLVEKINCSKVPTFVKLKNYHL